MVGGYIIIQVIIKEVNNMISKEQAKLLDECTNGKWRQFVHPSKIEDPKEEPSDDDLAKIEDNLDNIFWDEDED